MNHQIFNKFCATFLGSTYVVQWGNSHVWKVGGKVFAIGFTLKNNQCAYTFKTSDLNYNFLLENEGYRPAPYFANRGMKWIQQTDTGGHLDEELTYYLTASYKIVYSSLTKKKQQEIA